MRVCVCMFFAILMFLLDFWGQTISACLEIRMLEFVVHHSLAVAVSVINDERKKEMEG